ncbi:MAG: efflux RND transporter periplasmic adaptor subunit [Gammaproteobacteria bacterium]|jgi:membrane fusion protein (multidrug efflux system)
MTQKKTVSSGRRAGVLWTPMIVVFNAMLAACSPPEPPAPPPLDIKVVEAVAQDADITLDLVGQTRGSVDIPIRARVQGFLESIEFEEGRPVTKGQLLYTIDPAPFRSRVVEAEGYVAEARTRLANARADLDRIRPLAEMKAVSQQDLDGAVARYEAAIGSLQAAKAQQEQAEIELSYTRILSPIDGSIGISEAKVGEFVGAEPNPVVLNYVTRNNPIRVRFSINERDYLRLARKFAELRESLGPDTHEEKDSLQLILADGTLHPHRGHIVAYDAAINPTTGTFTMEADFDNPRGIVLAGQFARVRAITDRRGNAVMIPTRAITELQGIYRAFVVGDDNSVSLRVLELGPEVGNLRIIENGIEAGERVPVEGLLRLRNGSQVNPQLVDIASLEADGNKDKGS